MFTYVMASTIINPISTRFLLTRKEVADLFGVVPVTVKRWEQEGILRPIRVNSRTVRYKYREVLKLMDSKS